MMIISPSPEPAEPEILLEKSQPSPEETLQEPPAEPDPKLPPPPRPEWYQDMKNCRVLINHLMREIKDCLGSDESPETRHQRCFGSKDSYTASIETYSAVLLKLHAFERENRADFPAPDSAEFKPEDLAIIARFLSRAGQNGKEGTAGE